MTIENARVQHKILTERKDYFHAAQLEKRYPELIEKDTPEAEGKEDKADGKEPKG